MVAGKSVPAQAEPISPFPQRVGRYELLLPLGTGGMATVYLARAHGAGGFERDVALKLLHAHLREDEESKMHLLEEAKLAARIRHPNVVPVLEIDEDPFGLYLVMEYVEGETLSGLLQAARSADVTISERVAARILDDALAGLQAAHDLREEGGNPLGLVHRDFSPQNILVATDGRARLADFGIAKAAGRAVRTKTGLVKGKVAYMSPEQARGHEVDCRCDVWAAGVVAWELIAGRRLHQRSDDVATLLSVVTEEPPLLSSVMEVVSPAIEAVIASALTSDLERRCPTAATLRRRLAAAWDEGDGIATAEEVSQLVRGVVGPRLVKRGARVTEVRALRARSAEVPLPEPVTELTMTAPSSGTGHLEPDPTEVVSSADAPTVATASQVTLAKPLVVTTTTSPEASAILARIDDRRSKRRNVASGVIAAFAVAAMVAGTLSFTNRAHRAKETIAAARTPPVVASPTVQEPERKLAAERTPIAVSTAAIERQTPSPVTTVRHVAGVRHAHVPSAEPNEAPKRAPPRSTAPTKLASDPYGGG